MDALKTLLRYTFVLLIGVIIGGQLAIQAAKQLSPEFSRVIDRRSKKQAEAIVSFIRRFRR